MAGKLFRIFFLLLSWSAAVGAGVGAAPAAAPPVVGQPPAPPQPAPAEPPAHPAQSEADEYTRYELLAPDSARFHISYEVTATSPGATAYFNPIRRGSAASGEAVYDRATSRPLAFEEVSGAEARQSGLADAELDVRYLRIHLPRPVPPEGGVRLLIEKTYEDPKSYHRKAGDRIVFARPLGIRRNAVVLPAGYELVSCNVPSQVLAEPDGRTKVSFMHAGPDAAPLALEARRLAGAAAGAGARDLAPSAAASLPQGLTARSASSSMQPAGSSSQAVRSPPPVTAAAAQPATRPIDPMPAVPPTAERLAERAHQDRTIVYLLRQPESHAFDLYHDYTETREGTDKYLNVVRKGSASSAPSARILDTGEPLRVETLRGEAVRHAGLTAAELGEVAGPGGPGVTGSTTSRGAGVAPDAEVVIAHFPPVRKGESLRLRIAETYTDPRSYRAEGDQLVFDRAFGRPRNAVVLPEGWYLTASSIPATVSETADGRIRLDLVNPRPDDIAVLIEARRRLRSRAASSHLACMPLETKCSNQDQPSGSSLPASPRWH
jgi:hypothetical protein